MSEAELHQIKLRLHQGEAPTTQTWASVFCRSGS
jgi:hypothetical protein